jgi:peptidoglycan/LPS O-acetylase OafA/YrhL
MDTKESNSQRQHLYLKHIDGLRALCVLGIFVYHLNPAWLPGGFLGVDVFFIISGYLITLLFLRDIDLKGEIDFKAFYMRRFRRLFPSFLLVTVATQIVSYFLFENVVFKQISKSVIASLLGLSNIFFYKTSDYFNLDAGPQPLLHFWSLNVEEQFYLLWPILFIVFFKKFGRRSSYIFVISIVLYLVSFAINISHPTAVFYLPIFRFYLFIFGGWLAFIVINKKFKIKFQLSLIWISITAIIFCFFYLSSSDVLPGTWTPILLVSTANLLLFGNTDARLNPLNLRIFRFIGLRSYTIYLIHWPLIVFLQEQNLMDQFNFVEAIVIISIGIAVASFIYKFYEMPFRHGNISNKSVLKILSPISASTFVVSLLVLLPSVASPSASVASPSASVASPSASVASPSASVASPSASVASPSASVASPNSPIRSSTFSPNEIDEGKNARFHPLQQICSEKTWEKCNELIPSAFNVLIIGDSQSVDALNAMVNQYPNFDYSLSSYPGCTQNRKWGEIFPRTYPGYSDCLKLNQDKWFNPNFLTQFDLVVINVLYSSKENFEDQVDYLEYLKKIGVQKVVIFGGLYTFSIPLPDLIRNHGFDQTKILENAGDMTFGDKLIETAAKKYNYFFVSKKDEFCYSGTCNFWRADGTPMTWDRHHLSLEYGSSMLDRVKIQLKEYVAATYRSNQ